MDISGEKDAGGFTSKKGHKISGSNKIEIQIWQTAPQEVIPVHAGTTSMCCLFTDCSSAKQVLVWRYLFEAPLKRCAAALVRRDSNVVQNDWQEHIETE